MTDSNSKKLCRLIVAILPEIRAGRAGHAVNIGSIADNFLCSKDTKFFPKNDIADIVNRITQAIKAKVSIHFPEVMPGCQSWSPFAVHRTTDF